MGGYSNPWSTFKRGALALSTLGTSEIKTGGGVYGDETVADSLFPKGVNDAALDERSDARKAADAAAAAEKAGLDAQKPAPLDFNDETLQAARKTARLRAAMGYGRTSTFLTGPAGGAMPSLGRKTLLGG